MKFSHSILIISALLSFVAVLVNAGSCVNCGSWYTPLPAGYTGSQSSNNNPDAQLYQATYTSAFGEGNQCYWCLAGYTNICYGLAKNVSTSCSGAAGCVQQNTTYLQATALPNSVNGKNCTAIGTAWFWYSINLGDLKCGCGPETAGVGRHLLPVDEHDISRRSAPLEDVNDVLEEEFAEPAAPSVTARQQTIDCTHSRMCNPAQSSSCSTCTNCPNPQVINNQNILSSTENCPGYARSPYGSDSCPQAEGQPCGLCNYWNLPQQGQPGFYGATYSHSWFCNGTVPCLKCHVINMNDGTQVCGVHAASSAAGCFCAPIPYMACSTTPGHRGTAGGADFGRDMRIRQGPATTNGSSSSSGSSSGSATGPLPTGSSTHGSTSTTSSSSSSTGPFQNPPLTWAGPTICAPWTSDVMTVQCISGSGSNCGPASVSDCLSGVAVVPTTCSNVHECGGTVCGTLTGSGYSGW